MERKIKKKKDKHKKQIKEQIKRNVYIDTLLGEYVKSVYRKMIMYFDVFVSVCKYIYIIILVKEKTRYQTKY